jgi:hypothetical protein
MLKHSRGTNLVLENCEVRSRNPETHASSAQHLSMHKHVCNFDVLIVFGFKNLCLIVVPRHGRRALNHWSTRATKWYNQNHNICEHLAAHSFLASMSFNNRPKENDIEFMCRWSHNCDIVIEFKTGVGVHSCACARVCSDQPTNHPQPTNPTKPTQPHPIDHSTNRFVWKRLY